MRVALIDDGVVPQVVPRLPARNDLCVLEDGTIRQRRQDEPVLTDHGTTSAQILHMYAPEAEICSLRIFSSPKLRASVGQLAAALEWCWREKIPLIHLSLGTTLSSDYELLCPILARLIRGNQMVVAAHSNRDAYTVPACLMGVLGVSADPQMSGYQYAVQDAAGPEQVQITASSRHALTSPTGRVYETQVTNSYAAPVVTAAVHELLRKSPPLSLTVAEVYEKLAGRQVDISRSRPDFITEAIVYHPSAAPVCQEDLFFTVRAVAHTAAQWRQALREHPGIPTVLLPSATGEGMDAVLPETAKRLKEKFSALRKAGTITAESRACFIDDGSKDKTWELICQLHQQDPMFSGIKLSRNRGHQNALLCGLMTLRERADCVIPWMQTFRMISTP